MSDKKLELSRRKTLAGLGTIGIASAGAGLGTSAYLSDPETIKDNVVTAGKLDLKLDWFHFYKGKKPVAEYQPLADDDHIKPVFKLKDVKPGDWGCGAISIHVYDNPAWVWFRPSHVKSYENGYTEPERDAKGDLKSRGELEKKIKFVSAPLGCINTREKEDANSDGKTGKTDAKNMLGELTDHPISLDNWTTDQEEASNTDKRFCYCADTIGGAYDKLKHGVNLGKKKKSHTCYIGFCWCLPKHVGNVIQGDSFSFDLDFYAQQYRHNKHPHNPWKKDGNDSNS